MNNELSSQFYREQIAIANEEYQLSESAGDSETYYGRIEGKSSECEHLIDDYKQHRESKDTLLELDAFLGKNNVNIDNDTKEYKLLYRAFLGIKIDVCLKKVQMFESGGYTKNEYDANQSEQSQTENQQTPVVNSTNKGREERSSTYNKRVIIDKIAERIRKDNPTISKDIIADDVSEELKEKHNIKLSGSTILRDYSDKL